MLMKRVAIMGLGLMGGSLGLALRSKGAGVRVVAYARRAEIRSLALSIGAADEVYEEPERAVEDADMVVFCVPILSIVGLVERCRAALKRGCVVTDVGSTKSTLVKAIRECLAGTPACFIGSHPVAGSEQQGLDAARTDLYEGAVTVVTPEGDEPAGALDELRRFWEKVGSVVHEMSPEEHDRIMARTSHLPHVMAAVLASTVGRDGDMLKTGSFCGPGFRDTTRVSEGSPAVWHDILRSNAKHVADEIRAYQAELEKLSRMMDKGDFEGVRKFLGESRDRRRSLLAGRQAEEQRGDS